MKSTCRVFSCVVGRGCLLWPVRSLGRTLLAFPLLRFVLQGQIFLLLQVSHDFLLLHFSPLWWKGQLFWVLALEGLVGLHRAVQLQLLQHYWLGHRLGLLWYWMATVKGGVEGRTLISWENSKITTHCWRTVDRRMFDPTKKRYPMSKSKWEAPERW